MNVSVTVRLGRDSDIVVARFVSPDGELPDSGNQPNRELALGVLFWKNVDMLGDADEELQALIKAAARLGVPGLTAFGRGMVLRLPWTEVLHRFKWNDCSSGTDPLTERPPFDYTPIEELLLR